MSMFELQKVLNKVVMKRKQSFFLLFATFLLIVKTIFINDLFGLLCPQGVISRPLGLA